MKDRSKIDAEIKCPLLRKVTAERIAKDFRERTDKQLEFIPEKKNWFNKNA